MKKFILFSAAFIVFIFCSCNTYRYIYAASPANDPYFTKKGESRVAGYYSSSKGATENLYAEGIDLQGAYAVTDHFAVTANYSGRREKDMFPSYYPLFDSSVVRYKRHSTDLGAGYFLPLEKNGKSSFNIYAGYSFGKLLINDNGFDNGSVPYTRFYNSDLNKFYIQPALNFMPSENFHFALAFKFSFVHYGHIQTSYTPDETDYFDFERIANKTLSIVEPSFNLEAGVPQVPWARLTGNVSFASNPLSQRATLRVRGGCFSIGLSFDPAKFKH